MPINPSVVGSGTAALPPLIAAAGDATSDRLLAAAPQDVRTVLQQVGQQIVFTGKLTRPAAQKPNRAIASLPAA